MALPIKPRPSARAVSKVVPLRTDLDVISSPNSEGSDSCIVCFQNPPNAVYHPCGHGYIIYKPREANAMNALRRYYLSLKYVLYVDV